MWKIIQQLLPALLIIILLTQYVIPVMFNLKTWWLFRPEKKEAEKTTDHSKLGCCKTTLSEEIKATKTVVDEAKAKAEIVQDKADENLKDAEDLKKAADKLK